MADLFARGMAASAKDEISQILSTTGRDLTIVFASEILSYSDAWAWIKARISSNDFSGIHVSDYIPILMNGNTIKMQVAGIDTYYDASSVTLGHHIDFISKDCYQDTVQWNTTDTNNGNASSPYPYMISNVYTYLNTTLYGYLPSEVTAVISDRYGLLEQRYSSSGTLTDSSLYGWQNMGKLWIPNEYEVFGSVIWGTRGWSAGQSIQYPLFLNTWNNRIKRSSDGGTKSAWWLCTARSGYSNSVCAVNSNGGYATTLAASGSQRVPVCFRITE